MSPNHTSSSEDEEGHNGLLVDGVVGQVNGAPVSAAIILDPMADTLAHIGRTKTTDEFLQEAQQLIFDELQSHVISQLLLADATRYLRESERLGVQAYVDEYYRELVREYGQGSHTLAEEVLREQFDSSLQTHLNRYREDLIVKNYLRQELNPRIHIQRRDIETYYHDNFETQYLIQPLTRDVRFIRCFDTDIRDNIVERLNSGEEFATLASDPVLNSANPEQGGLYARNPIIGAPDVSPELNAPIRALTAEGQWIGPIEGTARERTCYYFIEAINYTPETSLPLAEVELDIQDLLYNQTYNRLFMEFRQSTLENGSYTDFSKMMTDLLTIARNRHVPLADQP